MNSYVSKSYIPDGRDRDLLDEVGRNVFLEEYRSHNNVRRWGNAVSEFIP